MKCCYLCLPRCFTHIHSFNGNKNKIPDELPYWDSVLQHTPFKETNLILFKIHVLRNTYVRNFDKQLCSWFVLYRKWIILSWLGELSLSVTINVNRIVKFIHEFNFLMCSIDTKWLIIIQVTLIKSKIEYLFFLFSLT